MTELKAIAFHEAGHAVVALALGCVVHGVAIAPCCGEQRLGELRVSFSKNKVRGATQATMVPLGGSIAQHAACPGSARGDDIDLRIAFDAAAYLASNPRRFLDLMQRRTKKIIERHWREVEAVAAALQGRGKLTGEEIDALFREG
jgi:ATP-dependent Zn protease